MTYNRTRPAWILESLGPPQRRIKSLNPCPPAPIKVRWNLLSIVILTVVSSTTCSEIATIAAFASAIAFLVPRTVMLVLLVSSDALSTSIWASVVSLISLMVAPFLPRMRATERVGTVKLRMLFDSFSYSTAYCMVRSD